MKKSAIFLTITLLFMMAFTSGCQKDATNEKNTQKIEKTKTVTPKNGIMTLTDEKSKSKAKTIKGYIYRSGNDYMVLNSEKGYRLLCQESGHKSTNKFDFQFKLLNLIFGGRSFS
ncbi:hypothetical protein EFR49_08765, partial [Latilactobacillus curvatus]|nr:hypothetical protein [Latilactobacillus curvatus]